jgi:hypothetical protein
VLMQLPILAVAVVVLVVTGAKEVLAVLVL